MNIIMNIPPGLPDSSNDYDFLYKGDIPFITIMSSLLFVINAILAYYKNYYLYAGFFAFFDIDIHHISIYAIDIYVFFRQIGHRSHYWIWRLFTVPIRQYYFENLYCTYYCDFYWNNHIVLLWL
jgi:hypothetical protein